MRRILGIVTLLVVLCGCSKQDNYMEEALLLRDHITNGDGCTFDAEITTYYQEAYYTFRMVCKVDTHGNMTFSVAEPDSISGITGMVSAEDAKLTFDDTVLLFSPLADDQITPVSAPWFLMQALRGGYIEGGTKEKSGIRLHIDDSYPEGILEYNIFIEDGTPSAAEIIYKSKRVMSLVVKEFNIL